MKRLLCRASLSLLLIGTACSTTGKKAGPGSSTTAQTKSSGTSKSVGDGATIGALSGAAIGGGLGAIVGSTSGHVGEGLAVGALAGGVAGAGVGAAVADYKGKQAARRDTLNDQNRQLKQQRKELDSVKDSLGDELSYQRQTTPGASITSSNLVSSAPSPGFLGSSQSIGSASAGYGIRENYKGNPMAKPYRAGIPASVMSTSSRSGGSQLSSSGAGRARLAETARLQQNRAKTYAAQAEKYQPSAVRTVKFSQNEVPTKNTAVTAASYKGGGVSRQDSAVAPQSTETSDMLDEVPIRTVGKNGSIKTEEAIDRTKSASATGTSAGLPVAKTVQTATADVETSGSTALETAKEMKNETNTVVAKQLGKLPTDSSASCIQAEKEAARASNATSDADRLFYLGRASRLCPTSDTYQVELGKVFTKIGKIQEAKNAFRKAADLNPQNDVAHDELSILENSTQ